MSLATHSGTSDAITTAVVQSGLVAAAKEMSTTLERAAYNPILFELKDYSAVITSESGKLWGEAPGLLAFLSSMPRLVQHGVEKFGADGFAPGDVLLANDPFTTGTHISDTTVYVPVFAEGELVAFTATTAHWADIGGKTPGGWCTDSVDVYQEGLRYTHLKLYREGVLNEELLELSLANVRLPETVRGDLEAQIAACRTGAERVQALCDRYGVAAVRHAMQVACDASEQATRERIRALPDGRYSAETVMDHDGVDLDTPRPLKLTVTIDGDALRVDFTGTSETAGGPINLPLSGTCGAVNAAIKSMLSPQAHANDGEFRVVEVIAPQDTMVNPRLPAPCDSYGYVWSTIVELMISAFASILPDRAPAGAAQVVGIYLFRTDRRGGEPFIFIDPATVGWGGNARGDGHSLIFLLNGDTPNVPTETIETRYPIRMTRHALVAGREGAGKHRGGHGVVREYEVLEDWIYTQGAMGNDTAVPRGVVGGAPGTPHRIVMWPDSDRADVRTRRFGFGGPLHTGERIRTEAGGGGGWGDPFERDPAAVLADVRDEFLTPAEARELYGVAIAGAGVGLRVDDDETARLRARA